MATSSAAAAAGPSGPNVFAVPLHAYAFQPWEGRNKRPESLNQWFNYGLIPKTWEAYAQAQLAQIDRKTNESVLRGIATGGLQQGGS